MSESFPTSQRSHAQPSRRAVQTTVAANTRWTNASGLALAAGIGELAELCGLTNRAIRYYEEQGLVQSSRGAANARRYGAEARRRLQLIATLRRADLGLREIAAILDIEDPEVQAKAIADRLLARLAVLERERALVAEQLARVETSNVSGRRALPPSAAVPSSPPRP